MNADKTEIEFRRETPQTSVFRSDYLSVALLQKWLASVAPTFASGTLVDFGCGNSPYKESFQGHVEKYIGVDVVQNKFSTVDHVIPPGSPLPFAPNTVDTILSTQTLEHVSEPDFYLREAARVLVPHGVLLLTCPASYMLHEEPHDFYRFTEYGLRHLLAKSGLRIVRLDTSGGAWRLAGQVIINHKTFGRKWNIPIISSASYYFAVPILNIIFAALDRFNTNRKDTCNYMIVARKEAS